ncbi:hypothetical protein C8F01DRAFT_587488 [Mycena amicta]|nr:hypothetical protein C8F01DRAFT_587488 [Mycena amicta]
MEHEYCADSCSNGCSACCSRCHGHGFCIQGKEARQEGQEWSSLAKLGNGIYRWRRVEPTETKQESKGRPAAAGPGLGKLGQGAFQCSWRRMGGKRANAVVVGLARYRGPRRVTSVLSPQHQYDALQALLTGSHAPQTSDGKKARGTQEKGGKKAQQHQQHQQQGKKGKKNKQQQADPWGGGGGWDDGGWGASHQENDHDYDDDDDEEDRRVHFTPITAGVWGGSQHDSYHMPSKTLAHAYQGTSNQTPLFAGFPSRNKISEEADIQFIDSKGSALVPVQQALFGYATRKAKDRIHWMFSPNKDERVSSLLSWIEIMSDHIGAYGLHRFLQSRERGALIANADYRPQSNPNEPAFDWLTFDQLQASRDKILQESVAFYDPGVTTIVFVFLPSKSGNSLAMWRRKINIRPSLRTSRINEISLAKAGLRKEKDYIVHVDELPKKPGETRKSSAHAVPTKSAMKYDYAKGYYPYETYEKKKKKWWNIFG